MLKLFSFGPDCLISFKYTRMKMLICKIIFLYSFFEVLLENNAGPNGKEINDYLKKIIQ